MKILRLFLLSLLSLFVLFSCEKEPEFSCSDGILNGDETGIDCGGTDCLSCFSCDDGILNGDETDVDCGGSCGYCLGEVGPGGGIVFYDRGEDEEEWRYLEASPSDQAEAISWGNNDEFVGNTSTAIGFGNENCLEAFSTGILINSAIWVSIDLDYGGKEDWFLPSKDELILMYQNKDLIGQFTNGAYWSSSEVTFEDAWLVEFSNGDTYDEFKTREIRSRAIRRF